LGIGKEPEIGSGFMRVLLACGLVVGAMLTVGGGAEAQKNTPIRFEQKEITLDHNVTGKTFAYATETADQKNLIVKGENDRGQRIFSFYSLDAAGALMDRPEHQVIMPPTALFYDFGAVFNKDIEVLMFLNHEGVSYYDTKTRTIKPLVATSSIYLEGVNPQLQQLDFARDVSGDGVAEIIIPDFNGYRLFTQDEGGEFSPQLLDMQVEMRIGSANPRFPNGTTPRFSSFPSYSFDINFDGRTDLVFLKDQEFIGFLQKEDGSFHVEAEPVSLGLEVTGNSWVEQVKANERYADQTNLAETSIHKIQDLNGDDIMDIITETDTASGVFNRRTSYKLHLGRNQDGWLTFDKQPNSAFEVKGLRYQTRLVDFDNDGDTDFGAASVKIGIGKIIGALISGSTDATLSFFRYEGGGTFSDKPIYTKGVPVKFNLSSGSTSVPFVELADISGDGVKDLLLNDGTKGIKIYRGTEGKRAFARKTEKIKVPMPSSGNLIDVFDLNGDQKSDLIIHFDRLGADGIENRDRMIILMAK
jgi:hypothetical protein